MELSCWWRCYYTCRVETSEQRLPPPRFLTMEIPSSLVWFNYNLISTTPLTSLPCWDGKYLLSAQPRMVLQWVSSMVLLLYCTSFNRCKMLSQWGISDWYFVYAPSTLQCTSMWGPTTCVSVANGAHKAKQKCASKSSMPIIYLHFILQRCQTLKLLKKINSGIDCKLTAMNWKTLFSLPTHI